MGRLIDRLQDGGPVIALLLVLSLISLTLVAMKTVQLWPVRSGAGDRRRAFEAWRAGDRDAAQRILGDGRSPADRVTAVAMRGLRDGRRRGALESEALRLGNDEVEAMNRHIRLLELIAMVSPLLGLLGTVLGMIQSFQELELAQGAANASVLAGGIWQALLTTATGLIVAIPAAIGATLLSARAESASHMIESAVGQLLAIEDGGGLG